MTDAADILMPGSLTDPIALTWFFGMDNLYAWQQQDILDILDQPFSKSIVGSRPFAGVYCNSAGKTGYIAATVGLVIMSLYPGAQIVSTSGSWNQIETQLWPALKNMVSRHPGWSINKNELVAPVQEVDGIRLQSKWTPFSTTDEQRTEGHHDYTIYGKTGKAIRIRKMYLIDEAKADSCNRAFVGMSRCKVSWKVALSSAGEDTGSFHDCFYDHKELWNTRIRPWSMCPHLFEDRKTRDQIEAEIRVKGRDDPVIKSQYFAEFYEGKGYRVFQNEDYAIATSGLVKKFGTDRAGAFDWSAGGDEQVWGVREGNTILEPFKTWHEKDSTKLARQVVAEIKRWQLRPDEIVMDCGGGGTPFINILENMGYKGIFRYVHSAQPNDKVVYADRYTEDCFERLSYNLKSMSIPKDDVLERQLRQCEYRMPNSNSGRRAIVSKEELRRGGKESPDRLDCLIMLCSRYRPDRTLEGMKPKQNFKCPEPKECFDQDRESKTTSSFGGWNGDVF